MLAICQFVKNRYVVSRLDALLSLPYYKLFFIKLVEWVPSFSPLFFPTLTIFLLVFHLFIACFMAMKYWCDRRRLYLVPIALAFAGSALLMVGTLSSFPAWLDLYQFNVANYNDAMIFYMFRHFLMAVLIIISALLYTLRTSALSRAPTSVSLSAPRSLRAVCLGWHYSIPAIQPCSHWTW